MKSAPESRIARRVMISAIAVVLLVLLAVVVYNVVAVDSPMIPEPLETIEEAPVTR